MMYRSISLLMLITALTLAGCATQRSGAYPQTRIPRPAPMPKPPATVPAQPQPVAPEVEVIPLERSVPMQPEMLPQPEPMMTPEGGEGEMQAPSAPEPSANPVVVSLLQQADGLAASGQLDRAAASVERGLRIAPKDASLWQKLAQIRLQQQRYGQAEAMAKKAIALARGRYGMIADNWKIIAEARRARGDAIGAERAMDKVRQYGGS